MVRSKVKSGRMRVVSYDEAYWFLKALENQQYAKQAEAYGSKELVAHFRRRERQCLRSMKKEQTKQN